MKKPGISVRSELEKWKFKIQSEEFKDRKMNFRSGLLNWFSEYGRDLPWRKTRDPYQILVSEIMLQQTQVDRVIEYWTLFLKEIPDFQTLAAAPEDQLLRLWEGLGYYNRVRNLQKTAIMIINDHHGVFPRSKEEILSLPGIGEYTAGAVMSFSLGIRAPIVDTNVDRVISRIFLHPIKKVKESELNKILWLLSESLLPEKEFWAFNQGIMDFGAIQCVPEKPKCNSCPFRPFCQYYLTRSLSRFLT